AEALFSADFDAIEIWNGGGNAQIDRLMLESAGDWFNLLNQGLRKTATGNASGRGRTAEPPGSPRNYVLTDTPLDTIDCAAGCSEIVEAIRAGRSFVTNGPIVRASIGGATYGDTAQAPGGNATLQVDVSSPGWARFDRIRVFVGARPQVVTNFLDRYSVECTATGALRNPSSASYPIVPVVAPGGGEVDIATASRSEAAGDLTITEEVVDAAIPGATRWTASVDIPLTGITAPTWVVVFVDGTCGQSAPLFPVVPNSLLKAQNPDLTAMMDHDTLENGVRALAFTNPIYVRP
ncbi:MAG: hypothetical protein KC466_06830, partial [Myxococcales bacterium]|nr:hypothetical protein [Myxococcales bacterium]